MRTARTGRFTAAGLGILSLLLAGCASAPQDAEEDVAPALVDQVIDQDFPDPDVLEVDGVFYAFATNGNLKNVQVAQSEDLEEWSMLPEDALPELPSWIIPGKTWAPEVTQLASGQFAMYFTATNFRPALQCIGVAIAAEPTGPYVVQGEGMLVCPEDEGGAIDASTFEENGQLHLLWKNDGNCCGLDTWISAAPLSADGLTLAGEGQRMFKQDLPWEGDLVEAPTMVKHGDLYYVFYSCNSYGDDRYAIGYATADSIAGPWTKNEDPFVASDTFDGEVLGPGGQDIVTLGEGEDWLVFHGWDANFTYRGMFAEPLSWNGDEPELAPR